MFSMYREPSSNSLLLVPRAARLRIRNGPRNLALLEAKKSLAWTSTLQRCVCVCVCVWRQPEALLLFAMHAAKL